MRMYIVLPLLLSSLAQAKTITVAVIDTGIDRSEPHLCKMGHKSFVPTLPDPLSDEHGHGTHVAGLINQNAGDGEYCLVAIKYYSAGQTGLQNMDALRRAIQYAMNIKVDFINYSGGGPESNDKEKALINKCLNAGITLVVAAGNEHSDLGKVCDYFPACYDKRLVVVGNSCEPNEETCVWNDDLKLMRRAPSSNFGNYVSRWEMGNNVESTLPGGKKGKMTGTSQATGVATGKLVKERLAKH